MQRAFTGIHAATGKPITLSAGFRKSHADELLQLADMTCGAVAAHLDDGDYQWFKLIAEHGAGLDCGRGVGVTCV